MATEKQEKIVNWLQSDAHKAIRKEYRDGKGFQVSGRVTIQPKGKSVMPITQALRDAGIDNGSEVGGFRVQVQPAEQTEDGREYPEVFKFFTLRPPVQVEAGVF